VAGQALSTIEVCNALWTAGEWLGSIRNVAYRTPHYATSRWGVRGRTIKIKARRLTVSTPRGRIVISRTPGGCIVDTGIDYVDCGVPGYTLDTYLPKGSKLGWRFQWIVVAESMVVHDSLDGRRVPLRMGATYPTAAKGLRLGVPQSMVDPDTSAILLGTLAWFEQCQQAQLQAQLVAQQQYRRGQWHR
jgi:hypothetical protein